MFKSPLPRQSCGVNTADSREGRNHRIFDPGAILEIELMFFGMLQLKTLRLEEERVASGLGKGGAGEGPRGLEQTKETPRARSRKITARAPEFFSITAVGKHMFSFFPTRRKGLLPFRCPVAASPEGESTICCSFLSAATAVVSPG